MKILFLFLFYVVHADTIPINDTAINKIHMTESQHKDYTTQLNPSENDLSGESRAGVVDKLNPFNKESQKPQSNKDDNSQSNNPLAAIQNFFSNAPQLFNGSNPFGQLLSSQPGGNFLDNIKIFFVGTQGMVMPASAILGGFQNLFQSLGNVGSFMQNLPTPLPLGK